MANYKTIKTDNIGKPWKGDVPVDNIRRYPKTKKDKK